MRFEYILRAHREYWREIAVQNKYLTEKERTNDDMLDEILWESDDYEQDRQRLLYAFDHGWQIGKPLTQQTSYTLSIISDVMGIAV